MKLYLSLACVALLSIGIATPVAAEAAKEDLTESERSRSIAPSTIDRDRESEELPQQEPAIATGLQPELPIQMKSLIKSQKLETKGTAADENRQPNPQLTQNISNSDDRSTSIPNPPQFATGRSIPTTSIPKVGKIEQLVCAIAILKISGGLSYLLPMLALHDFRELESYPLLLFLTVTSMKYYSAKFQWGIKDIQTIEQWNPDYRILKIKKFQDLQSKYVRRMGEINNFIFRIPPFKNMYRLSLAKLG